MKKKNNAKKKNNITLSKWFLVRYISRGIMEEIHIYANDEEQARMVALIQLRCLGKSNRLRIVDATSENL